MTETAFLFYHGDDAPLVIAVILWRGNAIRVSLDTTRDRIGLMVANDDGSRSRLNLAALSRAPFHLKGERKMVKRVWKYFGSLLALIVGCFVLAAGLVGTAPGIVIILGALAYRSAKRRRLGEVQSTPIRQLLETTALVLILPLILMQDHLAYLIATDPFPHVVIPAWAFLAYVVNAFLPEKEPPPSKPRVEPTFNPEAAIDRHSFAALDQLIMIIGHTETATIRA